MRIRWIGIPLLGLVLAACSTSSNDDSSSAEGNFTVQRPGVGSCDALHRARENVSLASHSVCEPPSGFLLTILREAVILWGTQPSAVCAYSTPINTGCGPVPLRNAAYCDADDALVWDQTFLHEKALTQGDFASVAIVAHEWGHLNQARVGLAPSVTRVQKSNELHADCHAGVFTAVQELQGHLDVGDANLAFDTFCKGGDPIERAFTPNSHGTCAERQEAFLVGFEAARANPDIVCSASSLAATVQICSRF
jgi:hypothetical protein